MTESRRYELSALELASGWVLEQQPNSSPLPPSRSREPIELLKDAVAGALAHPPCLVSFSGGRDSSAVLAVAADVARRRGLPAPIPATHRFPGAPDTEETEWQERVVSHLGLQDWVRFDWTDELDCIGPVATTMLRRHGVLWPFNLHFHVPLLEAAAGGSLMTGIGGDEIFEPPRLARAAAAFAGRGRPHTRDAFRIAYAVAPQPLRRAIMRRRTPDPTPAPWLREHARAAVASAYHVYEAAEPMRWDARLRWWWRLRHIQMFRSHCALIADDAGTQVSHPMIDETFLAALGPLLSRRKIASRTDAMHELFGHVLPAAIRTRPTKATFWQPFWNRHSEAFAAAWDGTGVDETLVDAAGLRETWTSGRPSIRTLLLLQAAWVRQDREGESSDRHDVDQDTSRFGDGLPVARPAQLPAG